MLAKMDAKQAEELFDETSGEHDRYFRGQEKMMADMEYDVDGGEEKGRTSGKMEERKKAEGREREIEEGSERESEQK